MKSRHKGAAATWRQLMAINSKGASLGSWKMDPNDIDACGLTEGKSILSQRLLGRLHSERQRLTYRAPSALGH